MLNNLSWQGYWIAIAFLTTGYYLFIYWRFFRKNFKIISPHRTDPLTSSPFTAPTVAPVRNEHIQLDLSENETPDTEFSLPEDPTQRTVYACMDELSAYFQSTKKSKAAPSEVLYALQRILQKYPALKDSEYKDSIGKVLQTEAEHHCSVHLSEEDLCQVWVA